MNLLLVSPGKAESEALFANHAYIAQVVKWCHEHCESRGHQLQCVAFLSEQEARAGEPLATTWMLPGACVQIRSDGAAPVETPSAEPAPAASEPAPLEHAKAVMRKHWLTIGFIAIMLAVLSFGK